MTDATRSRRRFVQPGSAPARPSAEEWIVTPAAPVATVRLVRPPHIWSDVLRGEGRYRLAVRLEKGESPPVPVWLELFLELHPLDDARTAHRVYNWFEGSIEPWTDLERPEVSWDEDVQGHLLTRGLEAPRPDLEETPDSTRALALLPHIYSLGVNRVRQELRRKSGDGDAANGSSDGANESTDEARDENLFPLIGFDELPEAGRMTFKTLRMNVIVLGATLITLRLPDLHCPDKHRRPGADPGELGKEHRATSTSLVVPDRFFPCWEADAEDVAAEVARHQAATARALSDHIREQLRLCADPEALPASELPGASGGEADASSDWRVDSDAAGKLHGKAKHRIETERQRQFTRLAKIAEIAERQLSRLLRRLGSYDPAGAATSDLPQRYRYALDEVVALKGEIGAARDRHSAHMTAESEGERSRFQNVIAGVGAAILIPTLVVGVFGANVWLPGEEDTSGLIALLFLILACGGFGGLLVDGLQQQTGRLPGVGRKVVLVLAIACVVIAIVVIARPLPTKLGNADHLRTETRGLVSDLLGPDAPIGDEPSRLP